MTQVVTAEFIKRRLGIENRRLLFLISAIPSKSKVRPSLVASRVGFMNPGLSVEVVGSG